jgi:ketosteroid isomerase-like protein
MAAFTVEGQLLHESWRSAVTVEEIVASPMPQRALSVKIASTTSEQVIWAYNAYVFEVKKEIPGRSRTMKPLERVSVSILTSGVLLLGVWTLPAWGQAENPPAKTKASGQTSGRGQTGVEQTAKGGLVDRQIMQLEKQVRESALKSEVSFVEANYADNYVGVGGTGSAMSKSETIEARKNGELKYQSIEPSDQRVRVYGNTAIVNGVAALKGSFKGNDISGTYRFSRVYVKQGGKWKVVNFQATKVQQPGS